MAGTDASLNAATRTPVHISYRRNGKLFSCEPCRKGKLRCDHASPTCGRCSRRGKADQCVYHPAPLTKPRGSISGAEVSKESSISSAHTHSRRSPYQSSTRSQSGLVSPPTSRSTTSHGLGEATTSISLSSNDLTSTSSEMPHEPAIRGSSLNSSSLKTSVTSPESAMSFRDSRTGFFGPTAYSAVYNENPGSLSLVEPDTVIDADDLPPLSPEKIQQGANILAVLRDMPLFQRFTARWFDMHGGLNIPEPVFKIWIKDMWAEHSQVLCSDDSAQLLRLSESIFRNTRTPFKTHGKMSATEWAKAASGRGLRWEVVGIILSLVGLATMDLNDWDMLFDKDQDKIVDRATFAERMRKASETCLCFCYECEVLNDVYICFMNQDLVLVEFLKGDAHYAAWQRTGELLDTVVAMGLHQGSKVDAETPFFLAQFRKKLFASAFSRDKVASSFFGRPPRLSRRYCKLEMPLDLSDEQLFLEGAELEAALATLDANGWNTSGKLHRRSWTRVWFQECIIREEILEIALGSGDEDIELRAQEIREKLERLHASFPGYVKITPNDALDLDNHGMMMQWAGHSDRAARQMNALCIFAMHAGFMLTEFLLQRALVNRTRKDTKSLIPISRKLLKTVLLTQARSDLFRDFQGDMTYWMAMYGLPSAGVLAIELLKQEQSRQYEPDLLPRSETIQDLSVYISALASVSPGEGNYNICNQGRRALKRVLDQILSPPMPSTTSDPAHTAFDDMSFFFPTGNDADFLQWLDNIEWDKTLMNTVPSSDAP